MDIKTKPYVYKVFRNDLVVIRKRKVTLTLNKLAYFRKCILELSKVLMYEFHYDYIKNKYVNNSRLLFRETDSLMNEIKNVFEDFRIDKEMYDCINYLTKSKYYDDLSELVVGIAIQKFV